MEQTKKMQMMTCTFTSENPQDRFDVVLFRSGENRFARVGGEEMPFDQVREKMLAHLDIFVEPRTDFISVRQLTKFCEDHQEETK